MEKNIVLLHGWGAETKKLVPLKSELERLSWNVLLPKLPGFEMPAPNSVWGLKEYSAYVTRQAKKYFGNQNYFVFGHSFGGGIAVKTAVNYPSIVNGIILCATRGISRGRGVKRFVFMTAAKAGKVFLLTPVIGRKFKTLLYKAAREHDYEKLNGIMRGIFKKVVSEDLKAEIGKIEIPVLVLWGREDGMTPVSDALYLKKNLKCVEAKLFTGQGHKLPYEMPGALAKEINLWKISLHS